MTFGIHVLLRLKYIDDRSLSYADALALDRASLSKGWVPWTCRQAWYLTGLRIPKGPCTIMVTNWALKGLLYHDFGAYVYTIVVLGPF